MQESSETVDVKGGQIDKERRITDQKLEIHVKCTDCRFNEEARFPI